MSQRDVCSIPEVELEECYVLGETMAVYSNPEAEQDRVYVRAEKQTKKQAEKQAEKQAKKQAEKQAKKWAEKQVATGFSTSPWKTSWKIKLKWSMTRRRKRI